MKINLFRHRLFLLGIICLYMTVPFQSYSEDSPKAIPRIMSGYQWDGVLDVTGWWVSEKLDGVRGVWTGKQMLSRSGRIINVPDWFTKHFPPFALDGELWIGRKRFHEISGIVHRTNAGKAWKRVRFCIFDVPHDTKAFEERIKIAADWFKDHPSFYAQIVKQTRCKSNTALLSLLSETEKKGGEGLMIRKPGSRYTRGRCRDILKVKSFYDTEALVIQHIGGKGKYTGKMGSLLVELPNGIRFKIGTGFSDMDRENPPPVGSTITFTYKELNPSGIPRFASFMRVRKPNFHGL